MWTRVTLSMLLMACAPLPQSEPLPSASTSSLATARPTAKPSPQTSSSLEPIVSPSATTSSPLSLPESLIRAKFDECAESFRQLLLKEKLPNPVVSWDSPFQTLVSDNPGKVWRYTTSLRTNVGYEGIKEKYRVMVTSSVMVLLGRKGFEAYCHNDISYQSLKSPTPSPSTARTEKP